MVRDRINRKIDYLRISVTDRCNLRCRYCMPPQGVEGKSHDDILRFEEIIKIVKIGIKLGIRFVRITGGEPLVRKGVVEFVQSLKELRLLQEISLTTNGLLLSEMALKLKKAGLDRVNISLDTLKPDIYKVITLRDEFEKVINGIESALVAGLDPVKVNVVVMKGINDGEILDFINLTRDLPLQVRFIEYMPLGGSQQEERYISLYDIKNIIKREAELIPVQTRGKGPALTYQLPGYLGTIGFITPISHNFCSKCNRIRLTADGKIRPCLGSDREIDLRGLSGELGNTADLELKLKKAFLAKPNHHNFYEGKIPTGRNMSQIGG